MALPIPTFPTGSLGWLAENFGLNLALGLGAYLIIVKAVPRLEKKAEMITWHDTKGVEHGRPLHPHWFVRYQYLRIITLVPVLWGIFLYLATSTGWVNPFLQSVTWFGIKTSGWFFDLAFARANALPNGAHIISYLGAALFGVIVWAKGIKRPFVTVTKALGDPFDGLAGMLFIGGLHEVIWTPFYQLAYARYLNPSLWPEVMRDVGVTIMLSLFVVTWWKYPKRSIPLKTFYWPTIALIAYMVGWFVLPALFGGPLFPITSLNNPVFGIGPYEMTPYFSWAWVNLLEVGSWVILFGSSIVLVVRRRTS